MTDEQQIELRRALGDLYNHEMDSEQLQRVLMKVLSALLDMTPWEAATLNDLDDEEKRAARKLKPPPHPSHKA